MAETLIERAWAWLHNTFPERQVYIRSNGRVQFFTFGPSLQATLAGLSLIFLGWVAFATVNVIFKDRIIEAKDHRYQQMQAAYENRVTDLQISYDELNGALVAASDKFKATADQLENKQKTILGFLDRRQQAQRLVASPSGSINLHDNSAASRPAPNAVAPDVSGAEGSSELNILPQPEAAKPRVAKPIKAGFFDLDGLKSTIGKIFGGSKEAVISSAALARHPALRDLTEQTARIERIGAHDTQLMVRTHGELTKGVQNLRTVMARAGINPDQFVRRVAAKYGMGGPEIPLQSMRIDGVSDPAFQKAYVDASVVLAQLNQLITSVSHIPLSTPVAGEAFERSSGFGSRFDPFSGRPAFHSGLDFSGPWGAKISATAHGTVIFAGYSGAYGNMVEVDHGFGIHTRYGHLSSIQVRVGAKVEKGAVVGKLGSTGRSTGPHVHYEVWYDDVVRNPTKFIEAGRNVF